MRNVSPLLVGLALAIVPLPGLSQVLGESSAVRVRAQLPYTGIMLDLENPPTIVVGGGVVALKYGAALFEFEYRRSIEASPSRDEYTWRLGGSFGLVEKCRDCLGSTLDFELSGGYTLANRLNSTLPSDEFGWFHIMNNSLGLEYTYWFVSSFGLSSKLRFDLDAMLKSSGDRTGATFLIRPGIAIQLGIAI